MRKNEDDVLKLIFPKAFFGNVMISFIAGTFYFIPQTFMQYKYTVSSEIMFRILLLNFEKSPLAISDRLSRLTFFISVFSVFFLCGRVSHRQ
jgi:hypothetical protein